jgi:hypothetical protein
MKHALIILILSAVSALAWPGVEWWPLWVKYDKFIQIMDNPTTRAKAVEIACDWNTARAKTVAVMSKDDPEKVDRYEDATPAIIDGYMAEQLKSPNLWTNKAGETWIMIASDWDMNMFGKENIHKKNDKKWCASIKSRFKLLNPVIMPDAPVEDIAAYGASVGLYQVTGGIKP